MAKADRDKKIFRRGLDKIAAAGGVSKLKDGGSAMKPVDKNKNPGLAKLPTKVRNKMGFMKKMVEKLIQINYFLVKKPETKLSRIIKKN